MHLLRAKHTAWRWALALLLLGFTLRVVRLGDQNVWYDEGFSVFMARQDIGDLPRETALDVHPPVYFALLHGWRLLAGDSEAALRYLSVLVSVIILAVGYRIVHSLAGGRAALLATTLLALQRASIWYSQEIRMYALTMLCALLALGFAVAWIRGGGWRPLVGYGLSIAVGLHTLYLFVLTPIALNLAVAALWLWPGPRRTWRALGAWALAQLLAALSLAPWLAFAIPLRPERFTDSSPAGLTDVLGLWLNTWLAGTAVDIWRDVPVYLLGLGVVALGAWLIGRARTPQPILFFELAAVSGAAVTIGLIWILNLPSRFQLTFTPTPRYLITLIPWAVLALGLALDAVWARWRRLGLGLSVATVLVVAAYVPGYYGDRVLNDTFRSAAMTLAAYRQPGDAALLHNDREWPMVDYYLDGQGHGNVPNAMYISDDAVAAGQVQPLWETHEAVWLLLTRESLMTDYDRRIERWLAERAVDSRAWDYGPNARLWIFARTPERAATLSQIAVEPAAGPQVEVVPGLTLVGVERALSEVQVGDTLRVFLYWRATQPVEPGTLGLRLTGLFGGTADEIPFVPALEAGAVVRQQVDFPIRPYVGAGRYRVHIATAPGGSVLGPALFEVGVAPAQALPASAGPLAQPIDSLFQNGLAIRSWEPSSQVGQLQVALEWDVTRLIARRVKQFWHLIGPDAATERRAQVDVEPLAGAPPMTAWPLGARVRDRITFALPVDLAPGRYTILTGLYDPITGERVPVITVTGAVLGDTVTLGSVELP
ncbi:MAG: glycosyltransferase family 39 protein [Anaerolineales bacterium]|nr:glycosyltransferase family 39 protein [Anaerolineales bacterium]